jgi:hypothetical protein
VVKLPPITTLVASIPTPSFSLLCVIAILAIYLNDQPR